jgi:STE24 endopeptidase
MTPEIILYVIIGIVGVGFVIDQVLDYLNLKHENAPLPNLLSGIYTNEEHQKSISYHKDLHNFQLISGLVTTVVTLLVLSMGWYGWLNNYLKTYTTDPMWLALLFLGVIFFITDLFSLPFQLYGTFVIEQKYGFNKSTIKLFFVDKIKTYLLGGIVGGVLAAVLFNLISSIGPSFWWMFWLVMIVFMLVINMFYTSLIMPLFNKLTPLGEGSLKQKIEDYCKKVEFPLSNIYVIDGSKRSSKANAFFSGIGKKKKVVFYDTLLNNHSEEELLAIFAHEVGHYKRKHIYSNLVIGIAQTGLLLFVLSKVVFSESLSMALGAGEKSFHLNVIAFTILFTPISTLIGIMFNSISRKNEYEADDYARDTTNKNDLAEALKKLSEKNLSNLNPHPLYVFVHYSHPPMLQRLQHLLRD